MNAVTVDPSAQFQFDRRRTRRDWCARNVPGRYARKIRMPALQSRHCLLLALFVVIAPRPLLACKCLGSSSVCNAYFGPGAVFIGKAESTDPAFDPGDPEVSKRIAQLFSGRDLDSLETDDSAETLAKLKEFYSSVLSGPVRDRVKKAANRGQLNAVLEEVADAGVRVTFKGLEVYKGISPDSTSIDVWTDFNDCGIHFVKGETYLVYASVGERGLEARACSRTRRLSDAGEDLVYLHFMQSGVADKGRIYGFVSSSELDLRTPHLWDFVSAAVPNLSVQLWTDHGTLAAERSKDGRFVFDELPAGDFEVTDTDWQCDEALSEPRRMHLARGECKSVWFSVPRTALRK